MKRGYLIFAFFGAAFAVTWRTGLLAKIGGGGLVDMSDPRSSNNQSNVLAKAIAKAEGYYIPGTRPARNNNPGDISDDYLSTGKDSGGLSIFATAQDGWDALTAKLDNILAGNSSVYSPGMSVQQLAQTWTGGDNADSWAASVASDVGLDVTQSIGTIPA